MKKTLILVFVCLLAASACSQNAYSGLKVPEVHFPSQTIPLENSRSNIIAYCWRASNARQSLDFPEQREINVVISQGDNARRNTIGDLSTNSNYFVYMLGCQSGDRQGISQQGNELSWRPNHNELTMVYGVDPMQTWFKFFSVSRNLETEDLGEPIEEGYQANGDAFYGKYFVNPKGIYWSPDGDRFATLAQDSEIGYGWNIWVLNLTTDSIQRITDIQEVGNYIVNAAWSSDGKKVAVGYGAPYSGIGIATYGSPESYLEITSEANSDLHDWPYVLDSILKMLFFDPTIQFNYYIAELSAPVWVHDDAQIIFVAANSKQNAALFIVNADGSGLHELLPGLPGIIGLPTLSPDGKTLAFIRYPGWKDRGRIEIATLDLETMEIKSLVVLPAPENGDELLISGMSWTPDGKYLAFSSPHGGESDIYVISQDGQAWVNLTADWDGDAVSPAWKP